MVTRVKNVVYLPAKVWLTPMSLFAIVRRLGLLSDNMLSENSSFGSQGKDILDAET
jgi:hypothetical protein